MGIVDGQPVDAANSNPAWLAANKDDETIGVLGLKNAATGADIDNIQKVALRLMTATGVDETTNDGTTYGAPFSTIDDGDSHETALTKLANKFDGSTGHSHNGSSGEGPRIDAGDLDNAPLKGIVAQGADLSTITGTSTDVSTELTGKSPSTTASQTGVVVNAPENKVLLRQATGVETDDVFTDGDGDIVYGRLTESSGVWTLSFYVDKSGVETAHDFTSSVDIRWYYQEIFNTLDGSAPVYSEFAAIPSDNATADVVDATETQAGKVTLATNTDTNTDVVQSQDTRLPTQDENDALAGTNGSPSTSNRYVTDSDPRNTDQRDADSIQGVDVDPGLTPTDGQILAYNNANTRFEAVDNEGGGGGGFASLVTGEDQNFNKGVGDWVAYKDAAASVPEEPGGGTGGSPTVMSIAHTTTVSEILAGEGSAKISKTAANGQGEGVSLSSQPVNIFQRGKKVDVQFKYKTSATYIANELRVFLYDETNDKRIGVLTLNGDGSIPTSETNGSLFTGRANIPDDCASVRAIIHQTSTDATAWDVVIDDFKIQEVGFVSAVSVQRLRASQSTATHTNTGNWQNVSFTTDINQDVGTFDGTTFTATKQGRYRINAVLSFQGNATGVRQIRLLKNGTDTPRGNAVGSAGASPNTIVTFGQMIQLDIGDTIVVQGFQSSGGNLNYTSAHGKLDIELIDPNALLSTTQVNSLICKVVAASNSGQSISNDTNTILVYEDELKDTHAAYDDTTGIFTAPFDGEFFVSACAQFADSSAWETGEVCRLGIQVNGTEQIRLQFEECENNTTIIKQLSGSNLISLSKGDQLAIRIYQNSDSAIGLNASQTLNRLTIFGVPNLDTFGLIGQYEVYSLQSDAYVIGAADVDEWFPMTGNSFQIPFAGKWRFTGYTQYDANGDTINDIRTGWFAANGTGTTTAPTDLNGFTNVVAVYGGNQMLWLGGSTTDFYLQANEMVIETSGPVEVFLNTRVDTVGTPGGSADVVNRMVVERIA